MRCRLQSEIGEPARCRFGWVPRPGSYARIGPALPPDGTRSSC